MKSASPIKNDDFPSNHVSFPAPIIQAEVEKEEKLSTSELLDRVKTVLGERCIELDRWITGGCWNLGTCPPASCSKGGAVVVWLQAAVTSGKKPLKKSPPGCNVIKPRVFQGG